MGYSRSLLATFSDLLDIWLVFLFIVLINIVEFTGSTLPIGQLILVFLFLFFVPGYTWIAAFQPAKTPGNGVVKNQRSEWETGFGIGERLILATGLSVAIVTTVGFVLYYSPFGIETRPAIVAVSAVTIVGGLVAVIRRLRVRPGARFTAADLFSPVSTVRGLVVWDATPDRVLSVLLVASLIVIVIGSFSIAASVDDRQTYTEFYLLSENESGERVAAEYPDGEEIAQTQSIIIGIGNHEGEAVNYTVVVQPDRPGTTTTTPSPEGQDRFHTTVASNETEEIEYTVPTEVRDSDSNTRVTFLLYKDSPPAEPNRDTAYRTVHFWINNASAS